MSPGISILVPRVLDNIRSAGWRGNVSVACTATVASGWQATPLWAKLGRLIHNAYFEQNEVTVRGSYFCVLINPQTSFTALLSICVVVANTACPPGLNIVNL